MESNYINIKEIAEAKGLKSTRSLRLQINKPNSPYIAREIEVNGGTSYEILYSTLEPEIQELLRTGETKSTALVPLNQSITFVAESAKLTALARVDVVVALKEYRKKFKTKKEADAMFLDLYNSGMFMPKVFRYLGTISIGTLYRWVKAYEKHETHESLIPQYKYNKQGEYNTILNDEMKHIFLRFLLHENKFCVGKAIKLSKEILYKKGYEALPCDLTFKRYAEHFRKNNYAEWILKREGMKAYHDKVEPYIERDIDKIEVGDVLIADGHVLNFQIKNPFTGKPTRATLVGFLDWKSTALVGYEIMMTENTQCIASALRNAIINLGMIPKVVYQDNGKAFKSKYFQNCDFDEEGFNGVYANLGIHSVFAKPYNARAKVIERFFLEFQEEFEKMMPSYIGTSIEDKPAWLKRGEDLHRKMHQANTKGYIPTVQDAIKYINCWIEYHNSKPCPNDRSRSIQEMLNSVQKQNININVLNDLMMKTESRFITKHGITFLNMHYRSEAILGIRDSVHIRYSLFDLSKIHVYSKKGEFLCVAKRVQKVHPMANVLGTVKDMEEYKQQYKKQQQIKNKLIKTVKKTFAPEEYIKIIKKAYAALCVIFSIFIFVRCGDNPNPNIQEPEAVEQTAKETQDPEYNINIATDVAYRTFTAEDGVLNKGYKLKGKLYQTRSKDFSKVYIFGALVEHNGQIYKCLWANNEVDATGMYESINQNAVNVSGIMSSNKVTMNDDGVAKMEQKLSEDLNNLNKPADIKINPNIACDYLKAQGLATDGYKSDGMGGYFCATPYKVLDGKSNVAYYVEGTQSSADKLYLSLNVYNGSNASVLQEQLANYAKILSKQALNYDLNAENVKAIKSGANSNIDVAGNYKIEIIKNNWDTQKGYDVQFVIKKK